MNTTFYIRIQGYHFQSENSILKTTFPFSEFGNEMFLFQTSNKNISQQKWKMGLNLLLYRFHKGTADHENGDLEKNRNLDIMLEDTWKCVVYIFWFTWSIIEDHFPWICCGEWCCVIKDDRFTKSDEWGMLICCTTLQIFGFTSPKYWQTSIHIQLVFNLRTGL